MSTIAGRLGKRNALIIGPGDNQSNKKPGVTLAAMASVAIYNPTKESLDQHEYSTPPMEIPPTNPIPPTKLRIGTGRLLSNYPTLCDAENLTTSTTTKKRVSAPELIA